ncbi:unnamed protein product [Rhizophagus irregularis]|nr:unnamed protein product [Rhizophagus irregularis]
MQSNKIETKHLTHQWRRLIAEENSDGSRARSATSTTIVTTDLNHIYTASTTVSTTTTVISPIAEAAAKASWNKPDINDHLSADERKDYQIQWKNVNGVLSVSFFLRRKLIKLLNL